MAKLAELLFRISADTKSLQRGLADTKGKVNSVVASMKKIGVAILAAFSIRAITNFIKEAVRLYDIQAKAEAQLLTALKGKVGVQERLMQQARNLQKITLFGDEETIKAQALIAALVKSEEEIMRVTPLVQDMATGLGMDLAGAASLVSKTLGSTTNALARYGIEVTGAVGSVERLESLITSLEKAFKGQAEAAANAGVGAITQFRNALNDLKEEIAKKHIPFITALFKALNGAAEEVVAGKTFMEEFAEKTKEAQQELYDFWEREEKNYLMLLIKANAEKDVEMSAYYDEQVEKAQKYLADMKSFWDEEIEARRAAAAEFAKLRASDVPILGAGTLGTIHGDATVTGAGISAGLQPMNDALERNIELFRQANREGQDFMFALTELGGVSINLSKILEEFGEDALKKFGEGLGHLASGKGGLEDILNGLLDMIGDFMVRMGEELVAIGIAGIALEASLESMNWYTALAAGAALIAAGVALSDTISGGLSGGGGSTHAGSYYGQQTPIQVEVTGQLKGSDIYLSTQRAASKIEKTG